MANKKAPTDNDTYELDVAPKGDDDPEALSTTEPGVSTVPITDNVPTADAWRETAEAEQPEQENFGTLEEAMARQNELATEASREAEAKAEDAEADAEA